jgi:hypothetical protein
MALICPLSPRGFLVKYAIEETGNVCKAFPTQPATEQRRLLKILVDSATWKDGEFEATIRTPFQKLRLSNRASDSKQVGKGNVEPEMKKWLPRWDSNLQPRSKVGRYPFQAPIP